MTPPTPPLQGAFGPPVSFPYNNLTDRQFEELLCRVFKVHLVAVEQPYCNLYDEAHLMPGVGERGQDVILTKEDRRVGLIQCKRYASVLNKPACAKEIIKFALNAICDPSLITDRDNFTYYLAITSTFSEPAITLLVSFNARIGQEASLETWTNQIIQDKDYKASLGHLRYSAIETDLRDILTRIHVKTIIPTELNGWLIQPSYVPVAKQFFPSIVLAVPAEQVSPTKTNDELLEEFFGASIDLTAWTTPFEQSGFTHLERAETAHLLTWIEESLPPNDNPNLPNSAIFLVGGAGCGKTTILHELLLKLHEQHVPVLGIKADRLPLAQRNDLEQKLNLTAKLDDAIRQLASSHSRIVVIIDQLDALSQSLSANRSGLQVYNRLIEQLVKLPNTRLVVSCRRYDLDYDPALTQFRNRPKIEVSPLSDEQIEEVLRPVGLTKAMLPPKLVELLRVPLHVTLFFQVYRHVADLTTLINLQDLYHELWTQKVLDVPPTASVTADQVRSLLQTMAQQMYGQQQISLPLRRYESQYRPVVTYLNSQSLITQNGDKVQFFHQSFFDYVFARSFVEQGLSLTADLLTTGKHQGLFIRSKIRQVLTYLREYDESDYAREVRTLLTDDRVRFHIRLLTIQHLASQANPIAVERRLVEQIIRPEQLLWETFLEAISTPEWFRFITRPVHELADLSDPIAYDRLYQLCRRVQAGCPDDVVQFLRQLPPSEQRSAFVKNVMFVLENFSNPLSLTLFAEANSVPSADEMWFYHVMENAVDDKPEWVGDQIQHRMLSLTSAMEVSYNVELPDSRQGHYFITALEKLHRRQPLKAFSVGLSIVQALLAKAKPYEDGPNAVGLIGDSIFNNYDSADAEYRDQSRLLMRLESWLLAWLNTNSSSALNQVEQLLQAEHLTLVSLGLGVIAQCPTLFGAIFFDKIVASRWLEEHDWVIHTYFSESVRGALKACFTCWSTQQQECVADRIFALNPKQEYDHRWPGKNRFFSATGTTQYELLVRCLPPSFFEIYQPAKKRLQELERKFPNYFDTPRTRSRGYVTTGGRAMSPQAYERMTDENWLESFIRYNARSRTPFDQVDESTHAQRFEQEVKQHPDRYSGLILTIIERPEIPDFYLLSGLEGLGASSCDPAVFKELFFASVFRSETENYVTRLLRLTDYWVDNNTYDPEAFGFIEVHALHGPEDNQDYRQIDLLNRGLLSVRGTAINHLYHWIHKEQYVERCFGSIEKIARDGSTAIRAVAVFQQARFNRSNPQRSLRLFIDLCAGHEIELAESALHSLYHVFDISFEPLIEMV